MSVYTLPKIVGVTGYARSGKDTVADIMVAKYGYEKVAFAGKLKELTLLVDPIVDVTQDSSWDLASSVRLSEIIASVGLEEAKEVAPEYRRFLQVLGNSAREILGKNVWVNGLLDNLDPNKRYVISDVRYPNEADAIQRLDGWVIRVHREGVGPLNDHPSETLLDSIVPNARIFNNSTFTHLGESVARALGLTV